jgi:hypothetical protein
LTEERRPPLDGARRGGLGVGRVDERRRRLGVGLLERKRPVLGDVVLGGDRVEVRLVGARRGVVARLEIRRLLDGLGFFAAGFEREREAIAPTATSPAAIAPVRRAFVTRS